MDRPINAAMHLLEQEPNIKAVIFVLGERDQRLAAKTRKIHSLVCWRIGPGDIRLVMLEWKGDRIEDSINLLVRKSGFGSKSPVVDGGVLFVSGAICGQVAPKVSVHSEHNEYPVR